jgi:diaminopimelate epimerase
MILPFYKLQGAGNDFVVIDNRELEFPMTDIVQVIPMLCDRKFGIGADGFIVLSHSELCDYRMQYFNADGSDAGMCGNGGRCAARLASHLGLKSKHSFEVNGNVYLAEVESSMVLLHFPATPSISTISDQEFGQIDIINTGTEHICIEVTQEMIHETSQLKVNGEKLRFDQRFSPKGTNVNFYIPLNDRSIKLVTYERGVEDLTLACGTGALASAICSKKKDGSIASGNIISVECPGGNLTAHFDRSNSENLYTNLKLEGPAEIVYTGKIQI